MLQIATPKKAAFHLLFVALGLSVICWSLCLVYFRSARFFDFSMLRQGKEEEKISLPYRGTGPQGEVIIFNAKLDVPQSGLELLTIVPDDCLQKLLVNSVEVPFTRIIPCQKKILYSGLI